MDEYISKAAEAMEADDHADMLVWSDEILSHDPTQPEGLYIAGMALFRAKKRGLATVLLNAASQIKPEQPAIWNNLACALQDWHPKEAITALKRALVAEPGHAPALANMVGVYSQLGRWDEAMEIADEYLKQRPDDKDVIYNSALVLMQLGRWKEAFPRWRAGLGGKFRKERNYHKDGQTPRWEAQGDATVVIYGEQGLGDEILGASMYERAAATGAKIIIECDMRLERLFARSFPQFKVYGTRLVDKPDWIEREKPTHRLECIGLGELFAPEPYRVKPFLKADPKLRAMCGAWLDTLGPGKKIGLAWTGGAVDWERADRNIPLDALNPILKTPRCEFISLEYQDGPRPEGVHVAPWLTAKGVDYDLTAALIAELDLVISTPTTVIDAAGALGTPCWAMVPTVPQWRFAEKAGDTAWVYDNVRVFRREGADWLPVTAKVAKELRASVIADFGPDEAVGNPVAVYDLGSAPASWDFINWLVQADFLNREAGGERLRVVFRPGPNEGFRNDGLPVSTKGRQQLLDRVCKPLVKLIGGEVYNGVYSTRDMVQPVNYLMRPITDRVKAGDWKDTPNFLARVKPLRGDRPVVITLREAEHWPDRNSNLVAWKAFARELKAAGEHVAVVRDTAKASEMLDWPIEQDVDAAVDLEWRAKLYKSAKCCLFTCGGPAHLAIYSDVPWLMFGPLSDYPAGTPEWWRGQIGLEVGEQYPWSNPAQRIIWEKDDLAVIRRAWKDIQPHLAAKQGEAA